MWKRIWKQIRKRLNNIKSQRNKTYSRQFRYVNKNIKAKGYKIVKVSDLIYNENYTINNNGTQIKK